MYTFEEARAAPGDPKIGLDVESSARLQLTWGTRPYVLYYASEHTRVGAVMLRPLAKRTRVATVGLQIPRLHGTTLAVATHN